MSRPSRAQFDQICRLCLGGANLVHIFERHPKTQKQSLGLLVRETVEMLGLTIEPDDGFPKKMCITCKDFLRLLYKFRNQCQEANDLLVEAYSAPDTLQKSVEEESLPPPVPLPPPSPAAATAVPIELPKPQIPIISESAPALKQESSNESVNVSAIRKVQSEPEAQSPEADSSSNFQTATSIKTEAAQMQEYLENTESLTEEYEYLEADSEELEEEIVNDDISMEIELQEDVAVASHVETAIEDQHGEVVEEEDAADSAETDNEVDFDESILTKSTSKGQQCKTCGKFTTCLKYHQMCHSGERPFACKLCDKSFRTSTKLKIHVNGVHLKVRKYTCDICHKKFLDAGNLKNHKVTHGGERKYVCDFEGCGKGFALPGTLTVHKKSHVQDKQFGCDFCPKMFLYKWLLVKHLRTHTGEKPFECEVCHKKFSTTTHLLTHKKTHDPNRAKPTRRRKVQVKEMVVKQEDSDASDLVG